MVKLSKIIGKWAMSLLSTQKKLQIWSVDSQENESNRWHQMSDFKAKMQQIRFRLGLTVLPRPPARLRDPTSKGKGGGSEEWYSIYLDVYLRQARAMHVMRCLHCEAWKLELCKVRKRQWRQPSTGPPRDYLQPMLPVMDNTGRIIICVGDTGSSPH